VVTMLAVLEVMRVGLYGLPPRVTTHALPSTATTLSADFGGMVQLIGYDAQPQGDRLIVDWYWRGTGQVDQPYVVFNHLLNDRNEVVAQQDSRPQAGQPLMTCWQSGEIYHDQQVLELKPDLPVGQYALEMGLYNAVTAQRVPVTENGGALTDHLDIPLRDLK